MREPVFVLDTQPNVRPGRAARPFLFVHGDFSTGEASWSRQIETLGPDRRLIVIDRRGNGKSPTHPRPYTFAQDAGDVLDIAERLGIRERGFHLVGHSYGGLIALETVRRAPGDILSLHLIEPPYLSLLPDDPDVRSLASAVRAIHRKALGWNLESIAFAFFEALLGYPRAVELRDKPVWSLLVREAERFAHQQLAESYPEEALAEIRQGAFRGPAAIYSGEKSHPALKRVARRLAETMPGWRLLLFEGAHHDVQRIGEPFDRALIKTAGENPASKA